jgi:hypothetical protein
VTSTTRLFGGLVRLEHVTRHHEWGWGLYLPFVAGVYILLLDGQSYNVEVGLRLLMFDLSLTIGLCPTLP